MRIIKIPYPSLVMLVGVSGSGKSTFANKHFMSTEVLSSDIFRKMLCDNENDQSVSSIAFELLYSVAAKRLEIGKLVVIDATNVQSYARSNALALLEYSSIPSIAIVLDLPFPVCIAQNGNRARSVPTEIITRQYTQLLEFKSILSAGNGHGIDIVETLSTTSEINDVHIEFIEPT